MYKNENPNGCSYSDLFIYPNCKKISAKESMVKEWYVGCKFFDPMFKDKYPKGYFWRKKGLAAYKLFTERKQASEILLEEMRKALINGYNPIPSVCQFQSSTDENYSPDLNLIDALELALKEHSQNITSNYAASIKSNLQTIKPSVLKLKFESVKIKDIELKHFKKILDNCNLSNYSYNKYRKHFSVLFKLLCANSCLIQNPCEYIPQKNHIKNERKILTQKEFDEIYNFLLDSHPNYANYCKIFHMSGCRSTELLNVRFKDVNLDMQEFIITVKKRKNHVREIRAIIPEAIPFWKFQIESRKSDDVFLFGRSFSPEVREKAISNDLPGKYWSKYIEKKFNTGTTFYSLKHLFLDKIAELHGILAAQNMAGHLNGKTTEIYTVYKKKRELEELKKLSYKF